MIERIHHMEALQSARLPSDGFAVVHSAWLALMGMRRNGDLDLILTSDLRAERFPGFDPERHFGLSGPLERRIRFMPKNNLYGTFYGARGIDDVIRNHCIEIDGVRFVEPRFYFTFKKQRLLMLRNRRPELRWWERGLGFLNHRNRSLARKIAKDERDFSWLDGFFDQGGHRQAELQHIPDAAWGLPDRDWRPPG